MSQLVFAAPRVRPTPPAQVEWLSHGLIWHGVDGSVWDLRDEASGVFVTDDGLVGLHLPEFVPYASESPARAGRRRLGVHTPQRTATLPVYIYSDEGSRAFQSLHSAFWKAFSPEAPGELEVTSPLGSRRLPLYLESDGGAAFSRDLLLEGHALYPIMLTAEDPYWVGESITNSWQNEPPVPFFGGLVGDGNLWISSGSQVDTATLTNPGDVAAWPTWTITAGAAAINVTLNMAGGDLGAPTVGAGKTLVIRTDPASNLPAATLNGVDISGQIYPWDPRPIPAGQDVPMMITLSGLGMVTCEIQPLYFAALT